MFTLRNINSAEIVSCDALKDEIRTQLLGISHSLTLMLGLLVQVAVLLAYVTQYTLQKFGQISEKGRR